MLSSAKTKIMNMQDAVRKKQNEWFINFKNKVENSSSHIARRLNINKVGAKWLASLYFAFLAGADIFILTPIRVWMAVTPEVKKEDGSYQLVPDKGASTFLKNTLLLTITLGIAGVLAIGVFLVEAYRMWRDKRYSDPDYIVKQAIKRSKKAKTFTKDDDLEKEIPAFLVRNLENLKIISRKLFGNKYALDVKKGRLIVQIAGPELIPVINEAVDSQEDKSWLGKFFRAAVFIYEVLKSLCTFNLDKLAEKGAFIRDSKVGKLGYAVWKFLQQYSYGYWVLFAIALFTVHFAAAGVAFSLAAAFGIPLIIPGLYLTVRLGRWLWKKWGYAKDRDLDNIHTELANAKIKILKTLVLRKIAKNKFNEYVQALKKPLEDSNLQRDEKIDQANEELINLKKGGFLAKRLSLEDKMSRDLLANSESALLMARYQQLQEKLKGNQQERSRIKAFFGFFNGYMFAFFAMWPVTDALTYILTGHTMFIFPPPIQWGLFALFLLIGGIHALHGAYKGKQECVNNDEKLKGAAATQLFKEISYLEAELQVIEKEYQQLSSELKALGLPADKLNLPHYDDQKCIAEVDPDHHTRTKIDWVIDFIKFTFQWAGAGAFLIRSVMTMGPILLFFASPITAIGVVPMAIAIGAATVLWTALKFYEYYKMQEFQKQTRFIEEAPMRKEVLISQVVLMKEAVAKLESIKALSGPVKEQIQYSQSFFAKMPDAVRSPCQIIKDALSTPVSAAPTS